jgi:hypothetical protein
VPKSLELVQDDEIGLEGLETAPGQFHSERTHDLALELPIILGQVRPRHPEAAAQSLPVAGQLGGPAEALDELCV